MNKLLSALIAAVFATSAFSALAADTSKSVTPAAAVTATATTTATTDATAPKMSKKHKLSAKAEKMVACKKDSREQKLKGADRTSFIKDCMSKA